MRPEHIYPRLHADQFWTFGNSRGYVRVISWEGEGGKEEIIYDISLREVFEPWIKSPVQVPCVVARGGCGSAGVWCTPMVERYDVWMMIEGSPPELARRCVYHRDGCNSIGPSRCPRFCAAPISARQHLIHIAATLSHPLCAVISPLVRSLARPIFRDSSTHGWQDLAIRFAN